MAFINEFVPKDDIEKYELDQWWNHYNPPDDDKIPQSGSKANNLVHWRTGRQQSCWLTGFAAVMRYQYSRWLEPGPPKIIWQCLSIAAENSKQLLLPILK